MSSDRSPKGCSKPRVSERVGNDPNATLSSLGIRRGNLGVESLPIAYLEMIGGDDRLFEAYNLLL